MVDHLELMRFCVCNDISCVFAIAKLRYRHRAAAIRPRLMAERPLHISQRRLEKSVDCLVSFANLLLELLRCARVTCGRGPWPTGDHHLL
eukprot:5509173-Amphidinium_carterae.1